MKSQLPQLEGHGERETEAVLYLDLIFRPYI